MNAVRMLSRRRPLLTCHGCRRILDVATRSRQPARFASGSSVTPEPEASSSSGSSSSGGGNDSSSITSSRGNNGNENSSSSSSSSSNSSPQGTLLTLAIETSCDDTCVALLEKERGPGGAARLLFHQRATADNTEYGGINPLPTVQSHGRTLAKMVRSAVEALPQEAPPGSSSLSWASRSSNKLDGSLPRRLPDFVSVTRGPGMTSALSVGLTLAKGLAVAWKVPLVGVHHMQAHLLTPRLISAMRRPFYDWEKARGADWSETVDRESAAREQATAEKSGEALSLSMSEAGPAMSERKDYHWPRFPFFTLLVSGGHTMLMRSKDLVIHSTVAEVRGFAAGDALDKCARAILPAQYHGGTTNFGRSLEEFVFPPDGNVQFGDVYTAPRNRAEEIAMVSPRRRLLTAGAAEQRSPINVIYNDDDGPRYPWAIPAPLAESREMAFAFGGLHEQVLSILAKRTKAGGMDLEERRVLAFETMRVMFEHLGSRVLLSLLDYRQNRAKTKRDEPTAVRLMLSGGVASNKFLRWVIRSMLEAHGYSPVHIVAPPPHLCTDNAAMIAWAGMEMFEAGFTTDLGVMPKRKWSLDHKVEGGILGGPEDGWLHPSRPAVEDNFDYVQKV
ncbi:hypothetical protein PspLS_04171 [Pyricularia sp. CBS 133598]|nr:hypothetical protein PspLS_04171 [Pyricularia sp. CBS 133598]